MDKILSVRQPYASALVAGLKTCEYRNWRIQEGVRVWIHATNDPDMGATQICAWLRELGDPVAADYLAWMIGSGDSPKPDISSSPMAQHMYDASGLPDGLALPLGLVIGWCEFGKPVPTTGKERRFGLIANPVVRCHMLAPSAWVMHQGALGLRAYSHKE